MVGDTALSVVSRQKYLGVVFDSQMNWHHHVAGVCKSMSYFLMMIGSHTKYLPSAIIKVLVECSACVGSRNPLRLSVSIDSFT